MTNSYSHVMWHCDNTKALYIIPMIYMNDWSWSYANLICHKQILMMPLHHVYCNIMLIKVMHQTCDIGQQQMWHKLHECKWVTSPWSWLCMKHKCHSPHYHGLCLSVRPQLSKCDVKLPHPSIHTYISIVLSVHLSVTHLLT